MLHAQFNPWKFATLGIGLVLATALITGVVVANYSASPPLEQPAQPPVNRQPPPAPARVANAGPPAPPIRQARAEPSSADIDACNRYASSTAEGKTKETLTDALIGGALGAGLGAAGGAIAGGGSGAGKGAGIGALVGAAGGTVYGLNESNQRDARAAQAYRACMKHRGYND